VYGGLRSWEALLFSSNLVEICGRVMVRYHSSLAAWSITALVVAEREILVGISHRLVGGHIVTGANGTSAIF